MHKLNDSGFQSTVRGGSTVCINCNSGPVYWSSLLLENVIINVWPHVLPCHGLVKLVTLMTYVYMTISLAGPVLFDVVMMLTYFYVSYRQYTGSNLFRCGDDVNVFLRVLQTVYRVKSFSMW